MNRKIIAILIAVILCFLLAACDKENETSFKLKDTNFYNIRLVGLLNAIEEKVEMEPNLTSKEIDIGFTKDGKITDIHMYIYGFDDSKNLISGYLVDYNAKKSKKVKVYKQDWHGQGSQKYESETDLKKLCYMLDIIDLPKDIPTLPYNNCGILSYGIREFPYGTELKQINQDGSVENVTVHDEPISGLSISLYSTFAGKTDDKPIRYILNNKGFQSSDDGLEALV